MINNPSENQLPNPQIIEANKNRKYIIILVFYVVILIIYTLYVVFSNPNIPALESTTIPTVIGLKNVTTGHNVSVPDKGLWKHAEISKSEELQHCEIVSAANVVIEKSRQSINQMEKNVGYNDIKVEPLFECLVECLVEKDDGKVMVNSGEIMSEKGLGRNENISIAELHVMYGEMISAAYDLIETSPESINRMENFLGCDDEMEPLFECLFEDYQYEGELRAFPRAILGRNTVDGFYGFMAFNNKTGDLAIIFRGTVFDTDKGNDLRFRTAIWPASKGLKEPIKIPRGFLEVYQADSSEDKSLDSLEVYLKEYIKDKVLVARKIKVKTITLAGHSLGASIATIAALGIAEQIEQADLPASIEKPAVRLVSYASPKVGKKHLWTRLAQLNVTYDHYYIRGDVVPMAPPFYRHHHDPKTQHGLKAADKELREKGFHAIRVSACVFV